MTKNTRRRTAPNASWAQVKPPNHLALAKVARKWGPWEEDPCGAAGEATSLLEGLEWAQRRALLFPKVRSVGGVVQLLALCAADERPQGDPTTWERMGVLITPTWQGAVWWPEVVRRRVAFLDLGRIGSEDTRRWEERSGHWPAWTASLIPLRGRCGRQERERSTPGCCFGSCGGRTSEDLCEEGQAQGAGCALEA